jgi:hypothetical protein
LKEVSDEEKAKIEEKIAQMKAKSETYKEDDENADYWRRTNSKSTKVQATSEVAQTLDLSKESTYDDMVEKLNEQSVQAREEFRESIKEAKE